LKLRQLTDEDAVKAQQRGYFDEHLVTLYTTTYGAPHLYEDKYPLYHDAASKTLSLTLFKLDTEGGSKKDGIDIFRDLTEHFKPSRVYTTSPFRLPQRLGDYVCEKVYQDKDFQIDLRRFDENLLGGSYKSLRYRVNHAKRLGYSLAVGRDLTPAHINIMAHHLIRSRNYELWDYQLYLGLGEYISRFASPRLFNLFLENLLIGFDVVDVLRDVMVVPLGFYLDYPSSADFLIHQEIIYAKSQGSKWLDIGWACNVPGLEEFKIKWKAVPRFRVCMQVFTKAAHTNQTQNITRTQTNSCPPTHQILAHRIIRAHQT